MDSHLSWNAADRRSSDFRFFFLCAAAAIRKHDITFDFHSSSSNHSVPNWFHSLYRECWSRREKSGNPTCMNRFNQSIRSKATEQEKGGGVTCRWVTMSNGGESFFFFIIVLFFSASTPAYIRLMGNFRFFFLYKGNIDVVKCWCFSRKKRQLVDRSRKAQPKRDASGNGY